MPDFPPPPLPPGPTLRLAGAPQLVRADGSAVALLARDASMLAWLAIEGPTPRARLATLLWPDSDAAAARNVLRQRLFNLRKVVGAEIVAGSAVLALAGDVAHDLDAAVGILGDAPAAADGEFAAWLAQQRQRARHRLRQSLAEGLRSAEDARDWNTALSHAAAMLALEPVSEAAHRRVVRLHYLSGDRSAALLAFDRCQQVLHDELGVAPAAETLALLGTIERAAPDDALRPTAAVPPEVLRPPRLVGRDREAAAVARALQEELVVLLLGEAGMGKTRLIADRLDAAGESLRGRRVVSVGTRPGDAAVPYALASRLLRAVLQGTEPGASERAALARLLPELGPPASRIADDDRSRVLRAVQGLLERAAAQGLCAVVVDDLQYADTPSIELLHPLVGSVPCGWILAMRPDELGPAARALVDAHRSSTRALTVPLQALDGEAIEGLLDSLGIDGIGGREQAASLLRRTGGNPMYLLETLKLALGVRGDGALVPVAAGAGAGAGAVAWPQADSVQRLIQQRLVRLGSLALKLARCAALAGQDLSPPLAAEVLGLRPLDLADAWGELEAAQVLRDGAFAHDLIAEAALALVPQAIARTLHEEIARFLERSEGEPTRIAAHWLAAGEPLRAAPHLTRAARRAHAAWQRGMAANLHEQVATILRAAGDRRGAFDAFFAAAQAASQLAGRERMAGLGRSLAELADDDGQRAAAMLVPAFLLLQSRQIDAGRALVLEALPMAQRAEIADVEVELLWNMALFHLDRRELADARQRTEQALARLPAVDPATARLQHLGTRLKLVNALGKILSATGHYAQGDAAFLQALQQARLDREWAFTGFIANDLATNALEQGSLERALDWSAQSTADDDRYDGGEHERVGVESNRGILLALAGDLGGALVAAEHAVAIGERVGTRAQFRARQRLSALQFQLGRRDLAHRGLTTLRASAGLQPSELTALDAELIRIGVRVDSEALLEQIVALDDFPLRARLLCLAQPGCSPLRILPLLSLSAAAARDQGAHGLWMTLQAHRAVALRLAGRAEEGREVALALWQKSEDGVAGVEMFPQFAAQLCAALAGSGDEPSAAGHAETMQVIALRAAAWMHRAAATLPAAWRQNYLVRAPIVEAMPPLARAMLLR